MKKNISSLNNNPSTAPLKKGQYLLMSSNDLDYWPIEDLSLCEECSSLTIPTKGRFIQIHSQEYSTQTVLDTGERQIVLNGRFLKTFYPTPLE